MAQEISLKRYQKAYETIETKEERRGFFIHFAIYIVVNAAFIAINLIYSPTLIWFIWPLLGWGAGLLTHYLTGVVYIQRDLERKESIAEAEAKK